MDSRTDPMHYPPVPRIMRGYGPHLPPIDYRDLESELHPANLRRILLELRRDATSHDRVEFYGYSERDCAHFDGPGLALDDALEAREIELEESGQHIRGDDGWLCLEKPMGLGCRDCEQFDCERVMELENAREDLFARCSDEWNHVG